MPNRRVKERSVSLERISEGPRGECGRSRTKSDFLGVGQATVVLILAAAAIAIGYRDAIINIIGQWDSAEYSHGYLIPFIAIYIAIQQRRKLQSTIISSRWIGLIFILIGLVGSIVGDLATLYIITHYALVLTILGFVIAIYGIKSIGVLWPALVYLLFMIPLPDFLYNHLSNQLELASSTIGVAIIRLLGITVFLEGNVIDLGVYKLQVAEACSGLRYLFPLMSFGFLCAVLYRGDAWQRVIIFLSTVPIAIVMNSLRIGVIGILVEHQGIEAAQGFLHIFEGWAVFMICLVILFAEALLLHKLSGRTEPFWTAVAPDVPVHAIWPLRLPGGDRQPYLVIATGLICLLAVSSLFFAGRSELVPSRLSFLSFPLELEDWQGREEALPADVLEALQLDDYLNVNYVSDNRGTLVNLYVAYYASQRKGASAHSPRSCIPGGGWEIDSITAVNLGGVEAHGTEGMTVNRVMITKGASRQLVYYWFQQRGRVIVNEYLVKWYMLTDALMKRRTDGAMVRLVTPLSPGQDPITADAELVRFIAKFNAKFDQYIPD